MLRSTSGKYETTSLFSYRLSLKRKRIADIRLTYDDIRRRNPDLFDGLVCEIRYFASSRHTRTHAHTRARVYLTTMVGSVNFLNK